MNIPKQPPKPCAYTAGKMILFGDQKWNLVFNMMIGIQKAVSSANNNNRMLYEVPNDFELKNQFELAPPRLGEQSGIDSHCIFTDYAPNVFHQIRKYRNIKTIDYINSIGAAKIMKSFMMGELSSLS